MDLGQEIFDKKVTPDWMSYDVENMNQALKIIYCEPVEKTYMDALEK